MKIPLIAFCVAAFAATMTPAMAAKIGAVTVVNKSDTCGWVTVYGADSLTPWSILTAPDSSRPQFIKPGAEHTFTVTWHTAYSEVKVRAELKQTADCKGHTIGDTYDVFKTTANHGDWGRLTATFGGAKGTYWMKI